MKSNLPQITFTIHFITLSLALSASGYLAHRIAEDDIRSQLNSFSSRALDRAEKVLIDAQVALIQADKISEIKCSAPYSERLRSISLQHRYVQDMVYMNNSVVECSALRESMQIAVPKADWKNEKHFSAWYTMPFQLYPAFKMFGLGYNQYLAIIDLRSFIDIAPMHDENELMMLDTKNNAVIAAWSGMDKIALQKVLKHGESSLYKNDRYYTIQRSNLFPVAIATSLPVDKYQSVLLKKLKLWLPLSVCLSGLASWLITRLLRYRCSLTFQLQDAIKRHKLSVSYQPIVNLSSNIPVGAEALLRWRRTDGSMMSPDVFIPLAERKNLITDITHELLNLVFLEMGDYLITHRQKYISLNFSTIDIQNKKTMNLLDMYLKKYDVKPKQICIEVTERSFMNVSEMSEIISKTRSIGHCVYIDDFGTGYSNLSYLQDLNVDVIKIDKSFIATVHLDAASSLVAPHIINMAHSLNVKMVAEGVEIPAQADYLRAKGVQFAQGWLFGKAMPSTDMIRHFDETDLGNASASSNLFQQTLKQIS
ncbi:EAL domain-containing protein [Aeromonas enterica]